MDPQALIPHAGPMCWLDRVVEHDPARTRCALRVRATTPLAGASGGRVPAHAALEYMAQTAAVHASLSAREAADGGAAITPATDISLLGTRSLVLGRAWLEPGEPLEVEAEPAAAGTSGLAVFATRAVDAAGREVARARLNLFAGAPGDG